MKKISLFSIAVVLLFAGMIRKAVAQDTMQTLPPVVIYAKSNIDKALASSFDKSFQKATDIRWSKMNKNFLASFILGDTKNNALYRKNGSLIYHIQWGQEKHLPSDIREQVSYAYSDYRIAAVIYIHADNRKIWVVNLEGLKKYVIASVEDGELQEVATYDKSL